MADEITTTLGIMVDIESLDLGPKSVVTQIGLYPFSMEEEEIDSEMVLHTFLPIQPQFDLGRTVSADTLVWWMNQKDEARAGFERNLSDAFEELPVLMRQFVRRFEKITNGLAPESYEVIARGPQFDLVNIETLLAQCGERTPWRYDRVTDLRTLMRYAGLHARDVPPPEGFVAHDAGWDCRYQIKQYLAAKRGMRAR